MNVNQIDSKLTLRTRRVFPLHFYGQTVDMDPLIKIAKDNNSWIIEDCAQA